MATTLLPFRDYDEHDVLNLFGLQSSATLPVTKGHMVKITTGWKNTDEISLLGDAGNNFTNTVSERYGVVARVGLTDADDTDVLGMLLHDVKETDENGEKLVFNPRKAAEMEVALSGQAVPVLTRGIVLYSGTQLTTDAPAAGAVLYSDANGELTTSSGGGDVVGVALGAKDDNNHVLVRINL